MSDPSVADRILNAKADMIRQGGTPRVVKLGVWEYAQLMHTVRRLVWPMKPTQDVHQVFGLTVEIEARAEVRVL